MKLLLSILEEINPGIDYKNETHLIDDNKLDSLSVLSLVAEIEDAFDIEISPTDLIPANFNSAKSLMMMINRLKEE